MLKVVTLEATRFDCECSPDRAVRITAAVQLEDGLVALTFGGQPPTYCLKAEDLLQLLSPRLDLQPVAVEPSEDGTWYHPAVPWELWGENEPVDLKKYGYELTFVSIYDDDPESWEAEMDSAEAEGRHVSFSWWRPEKPGWIPLARYDSEEGPFASFARAVVQP